MSERCSARHDHTRDNHARRPFAGPRGFDGRSRHSATRRAAAPDFGGFTVGERHGPPIVSLGKDRDEFADFYKLASERGTLFFEPGDQIKKVRSHWICTGSITCTGQAALQREIDLLKAAASSGGDLFLTSTAPASLEVYRSNEYYTKEEDFVFALAEALHEEYNTIVESGIITHPQIAWAKLHALVEGAKLATAALW
jgi:hypothetical protein